MVEPFSEEALREPVIMEWDELEWGGVSPGVARVIHVSPDRRTITILRLDGRSWPEKMPYAFAWSMVDTCAWTHRKGKPKIFSHVSTLSDRQKELRDENWRVVGSMLENCIPAIFDKKARVALATEAAALNRCTRRHVMNLLKRAFEQGMSRDSVRSPLDGNGKYERVLTPDSKKRGRPVEIGEQRGLNVDEEIKQFFANALRLFWARNKRMNLKDAYDLCLRLYFMDLTGDLLDGGEHKIQDRYAKSGVPTEGQFQYWADKVVDLESLRRRKMKPRVYDQKNRPILGTSNAAIWGPGGRFQIDATVLDIYIRSRRTRKQLIGRPTLYVVIDTFSRLIVGIYIGLEAPSWIGAMMALANCVEDKVEFCRRFKIDISPEDWPTGMIPAILLGDRGEIERAVAEHMIDLMKIKVETAAAYRGDWKGIVESSFRTLPAIFRPYVDGYIETDFRQRGVRDYRADAVLDLDDLTAIIIELVLYHNNDHVNDQIRSAPATDGGRGSVDPTRALELGRGETERSRSAARSRSVSLWLDAAGGRSLHRVGRRVRRPALRPPSPAQEVCRCPPQGQGLVWACLLRQTPHRRDLGTCPRHGEGLRRCEAGRPCLCGVRRFHSLGGVRCPPD